jgi:hypothetical protein
MSFPPEDPDLAAHEPVSTPADFRIRAAALRIYSQAVVQERSRLQQEAHWLLAGPREAPLE